MAFHQVLIVLTIAVITKGQQQYSEIQQQTVSQVLAPQVENLGSFSQIAFPTQKSTHARPRPRPGVVGSSLNNTSPNSIAPWPAQSPYLANDNNYGVVGPSWNNANPNSNVVPTTQSPYYDRNNNHGDHTRNVESPLGATITQLKPVVPIQPPHYGNNNNYGNPTGVAGSPVNNAYPNSNAVSTTQSPYFINAFGDPIKVATSSSNTPRPQDNYEFIRDFSWTLFQRSRLPSPTGNLVQSPIQPQLLLSLLRTAAVDKTEEQIGTVIKEINSITLIDLVNRLKQVSNSNSELNFANAIFIANYLGLNNSFYRETQSRSVEIYQVNFNNIEDATNTINNWISSKTRNQISISYRPDQIRGEKLLLANTAYFRGVWKHEFNDTVTAPFRITRQELKYVPMMKSTVSLRSGDITLSHSLSGRWVEIPYTGEQFSMIIILPLQDFQLQNFIESMKPSDFSEIFKQLSGSYRKLVHLSLPRFSVQSTFSMVDVLSKMGIRDLFSQSCRLPYLASTQHESLRVDNILQQGILRVDEKGTTAASVTISHVVTLSLNSAFEEITFNVDQPFISVIVDKLNKVPIFISKIFDPQELLYSK